MNPTRYYSVHDAWRGILRYLKEHGDCVSGTIDPLSVGSAFLGRSRECIELVGASIAVEQPRNRLVSSRAKGIRPAFLLANVIYALSGSEDLGAIAHYNRNGTAFSDDGATLPNSLGKRLCGLESVNQLEACRLLLARDPYSRRAVAALYAPGDAGSPSRDCPCLLHLQFLRRRDALSCVVGVRSQSAAMLFPYDAFLVSMLQESLAVSLGVEVGTLVFQFGSVHYYKDEENMVDSILAESLPHPTGMPRMRQSATAVLAELIHAERGIRLERAVPANLTLDDYWREYIKALDIATNARDPSLACGRLDESWYGGLSRGV